jgi:hypothetical protein
MLADLEEVLGSVIHADLSLGWHNALAVLSTWQGPMVVAHRDFAPWNVRWWPEGVFVFDWEYAVEQASPLHDFFHFHLVQDALSMWKRLTPKRLLLLIRAAQVYARQTYSQADWNHEVVRALLLTYLLDVVLFYTASGRLFDPSHPVLAGYHALIRERNKWLRS